MNKLLRFMLCAGLALLMPLAIAAPPQTISYQGYLTNAGGTPVNSAVVMTFRLYNAASGGSALYIETQLSVGVANGNSFGLTWRNRFQGGDPTSLLLDVTGAAVGSLPLLLTDNFTFDGVPPGTYTFRLRAVNRFGTGAASAPVTLTFPSACTGVPNPVVAFVAHAIGNTVYIKWRTPATGVAPTGYLLSVSGAFTGTFPVTGHELSGAVGAGSYTLSMVATNACGTSAAVPAQTVTVP